jgi:hypothetical protein
MNQTDDIAVFFFSYERIGPVVRCLLIVKGADVIFGWVKPRISLIAIWKCHIPIPQISRR